MAIDFQLNGHRVRVEPNSHNTLLDFLRSQGLTGAKEGCAEGECGACTVLMVGPRDGRAAYVPVNSCLILLPMAAGQEIYTVEALAGDRGLHEVQQAMVESGGSQCGYCTPGFVVSLFAEQYRHGRAGACDTHAMSGNLCRCTGYRPIAAAAACVGEAPADSWRERLAQPAPVLDPIECDGFSRPTSLAECFARLAEHPDARLIAGGTDLVVEANLRLRRFAHLISVEAIHELREFRDTASQIEIGAALPLAEIGVLPREFVDLFASPLIRNRATLGGNLATASPIGDGAPLLLAMDARVRLVSARGERMLPLTEFFRAYRKTALEAGEVIASVILPKPLPSVVRFYKAAKRRMDDISTVAAAFAIDHAGKLRIAYGGVAPIPLRAFEAESALSAAKARDILARTLHPISDHRGSAAYRLALAQNLLEKFRYEEAA